MLLKVQEKKENSVAIALCITKYQMYLYIVFMYVMYIL